MDQSSPVPPPYPVGGATNHPVSYCRNCGNRIAPNSIACMGCGLAPSNGNNFCPACAAETHPQAIVCIKCGVGLQSHSFSSFPVFQGGNSGPIQTRPMDPTAAALLSLLLPGVSQMQMGQNSKGLAMLIIAIVVGTLTACIFSLVYHPLAAYDAYQIASKIKHGRTVNEWEWF